MFAGKKKKNTGSLLQLDRKIKTHKNNRHGDEVGGHCGLSWRQNLKMSVRHSCVVVLLRSLAKHT